MIVPSQSLLMLLLLMLLLMMMLLLLLIVDLLELKVIHRSMIDHELTVLALEVDCLKMIVQRLAMDPKKIDLEVLVCRLAMILTKIDLKKTMTMQYCCCLVHQADRCEVVVEVELVLILVVMLVILELL